MSNRCHRCFRDLDKIPEIFRDYIHLDNTGRVCLDFDFGNITPEVQRYINDLVDGLVKNIRQTLDEIER